MKIEDQKFPVCERCWIAQNSSWEADSISPSGDIVTRLTKIAIPLVLDPGTVSSCVLCEKVTVVGLYITFDELGDVDDDDDDDDMEINLGDEESGLGPEA